METESAPFVTVVVPAYNERAYIGACLDSLLNSDYPGGQFEVLVVDGGSDDGSRDIVLQRARESDSIRLLDNPRRLTPASVNIGVQGAKGGVVIILGAHSYVAPDFVSQSVAHLLRSGAACVGGPIKSVSNSYVGKAIALAMSSPFGVGNALFRYSLKEQYVDTVAFGAYRREVFDNVGLFDETCEFNADDDFHFRLRKSGRRILLTPSIRSFYHPRTSLRQLWKQYFRYGLWKVPVLQRHPEGAMFRHGVPFALVSVLMASGLLGLLFPVFARLFLLVAAGYLAASLVFSCRIASSNGWKYLGALPAAFASLHFAYGLGFLVGLLRLVGGWMRAPPPHKAHDSQG